MKIPKHIAAKIENHGRETYPEECCGVLFGRLNGEEKTVEDCLPIENARKGNRQRRFLITPDDYLKAERESQKRGCDIVGFYHSHPDHPARPSQHDLEHAWPWYSYVILSVEHGESKTVTSWVINEDRTQFQEEKIKVI